MIARRQSSGRPPQAVPQEVNPPFTESQSLSQTGAPVVLVPSRAMQPTLDVGRAPEREEAAVHTLGLTFVLVPASTFLMGSPEQELGRAADEHSHEVTITQSFSLQTTPVTQGQWQALMGRDVSVPYREPNLPVAGVNWQDCQEFIARLNARGERTYRLPTEAEWEYACRGGNSMALANGSYLHSILSSTPCWTTWAGTAATPAGAPSPLLKNAPMPGASTVCMATWPSGARIGVAPIPTPPWPTPRGPLLAPVGWCGAAHGSAAPRTVAPPLPFTGPPEPQSTADPGVSGGNDHLSFY